MFEPYIYQYRLRGFCISQKLIIVSAFQINFHIPSLCMEECQYKVLFCRNSLFVGSPWLLKIDHA
jgi:hypothetical protein